MTFAMGRRFVIADGVERWKDAEVEPVAHGAATSADPETLTVAFFAREEGRYKAPAKLVEAVEKAGGQIAAEMNVKAWDLPKWLIEQAKDAGSDLDRDGAKALVAQVGDRQQRLMRELEKLALEHGPGANIGVDEVEESCATSAERKVWTLADALVAGDRKTSLALAARAARAGRARHRPDLQHGPPAPRRGGGRRALQQPASPRPRSRRRCGCRRGPPTSSSRTSRRVTSRRCASALAAMADLEVESRGGELSEDTEAVQRGPHRHSLRRRF